MAIVRSTYAHEAEAQAAARSVVEAGLAACAHVQALRSTYRWQGRLVAEAEWLLEARVLEDGVQEALRHLAATHPYQVPLLETFPTRVEARYAAWAEGQARTGG